MLVPFNRYASFKPLNPLLPPSANIRTEWELERLEQLEHF
jgi:hypothetical protein